MQLLQDGADTEEPWLDQAWSAAAHEQPIAAFLTSVKVTPTVISAPFGPVFGHPLATNNCLLMQVSRLLAVKARADDASFSIMHELPVQFHTVRSSIAGMCVR